ncbi:MAG: 4-hydroxythreonine-4-phosphate dehydrogenase PdxA [Cyanobacterium sp. T60_A2020_053]|nr:4-hydroxythreonine-4-phosphate dehydrogenase PdxA [Cyanobacterium sp. T60_A2020_053]
MRKINLAITLGDPVSIGGEIILKSLANSALHQKAHITIIGDGRWLKYTYNSLTAKANLTHPHTLNIIDVTNDFQGEWGKGDAESGKASFLYLQKAIELTQQGQFDGIVTAPIAKYLWQQAGYNYPGQTEVLAEKSATAKFAMMFVGKSPYTHWVLRTILATTHIPLKTVSKSLNEDVMDVKLELLIKNLKEDFNLSQPTIAIAGLNPHSGENGKLGKEEKEWLENWLNKARQKYPEVKLIGLIPPDTMWIKPTQAWFRDGKIKTADGFFALYHDQGLIPVKAMAFDQAVNTTIGLPFVRTSPDHGTAFDIAGQGIADASSLTSAIEWAIYLCQNRLRLKNLV